MKRLFARIGLPTLLGLPTILGLIASPAFAQSLTDPAAIDRAVAEFTGVPLGAPGGAALRPTRGS